jgi:hypothetical protein
VRIDPEAVRSVIATDCGSTTTKAILLAGGTDGGTKKHVIAVAELLRAAQPRPRLGHAYSLPVIYAGNQDLNAEITAILGAKV